VGFLILESLGSTELLFILVMSLVFFGPRKLPQISRSQGKNLAEFRRASEDFKATWNREVSLEEFNMNSTVDHVAPPKEKSLPGSDTFSESPQSSSIGAVAPDGVVPHQPMKSDAPGSSPDIALSSGDFDSEMITDQVEPSRKRDWL
jgi:Sec-independent protein translocase protein TatA